MTAREIYGRIRAIKHEIRETKRYIRKYGPIYAFVTRLLYLSAKLTNLQAAKRALGGGR